MLPLALAVVITVADTTVGNPNLFAGLSGTWSCTTAAGSSVVQRFTIAADGDIDEHIEWVNDRVGGQWHQAFSYDPAAGIWNVKNTGSNGAVFTGTIRDADGNVADIVGTQTSGKATTAYRERFVFKSPTAFSHAWEAQAQDGTWRPTSFAECSLTQRQ